MQKIMVSAIMVLAYFATGSTMEKHRLKHEELKSLLAYDEATGIFTWASDRARFKAGQQAGSVSKKHGYIDIGIKMVSYRAHRLAWLYITGEWPREMIDHINGVRTDNRFCNLRLATCSENQHNRGAKSSTVSGLKGVCWHGGAKKWMASITLHGRNYHIGYFHSAQAAHAAYCERAAVMHGEFANFG